MTAVPGPTTSVFWNATDEQRIGEHAAPVLDVQGLGMSK